MMKITVTEEPITKISTLGYDNAFEDFGQASAFTAFVPTKVIQFYSARVGPCAEDVKAIVSDPFPKVMPK